MLKSCLLSSAALSHVHKENEMLSHTKTWYLTCQYRSIFGYLIMCSFISWKNPSIGWNDEWIESLTWEKNFTRFTQQQQQKVEFDFVYVLLRFTFKCICLTERDFFGSLSTRRFFCSRFTFNLNEEESKQTQKQFQCNRVIFQPYSTNSNTFRRLYDEHFWQHSAATGSKCWLRADAMANGKSKRESHKEKVCIYLSMYQFSRIVCTHFKM